MNPTAYRIREASVADVNAILALQQTCAEAPYWTHAAWLKALAPAPAPARIVFAADTPATLVGFAVGVCSGTLAELESVAVSVQSRRQGIAKGLCQKVIEWSRQTGAQSIELEVRASSQGALALYRSLGFHEQGTRRGYYRDPPDDAVLMAAPL